MMNLPRLPPGANYLRFNLWTLQISTPGTFLTACGKFYDDPSYTTKGPLLYLYFLFLNFPTPDLTFLAFSTLSTSAYAPNLFKNAITSFVFERFSILSSTTNGRFGTSSTLWPLAYTNGVIAEAAKAEATACLFCLRLTFLCHLLHVFNGANILPFLHWLPKAAYPALWVPDPLTLGIRATALPVPHDSAECFIPALSLTACAYLEFFEISVNTRWTISSLIGATKTPGNGCLDNTSAGF